MLRSDIDIWPVDLESSWYIKRHVIEVCTKCEQNRAIPDTLLIILRIFGHVMSRCDLDRWPWTFTKFERNRINHVWVIDDLARFRHAISGVSTSHRGLSVMRAPNFTKLGEPCCIFKYGRLIVEWCWSYAKFRTFWPPVKIRGGVGEISMPIVEALPTTEPPEYNGWPSTTRLLSAVDW